jgi:hypothetical protein
MSLKGKTFVDNATKQSGTVVNVNEGIAILDNGSRVIESRLMDSNYYTEEITLDSMSNGLYGSLASQLSNINTENMSDYVDPGASIKMIDPVESHSEAQRKYNQQSSNTATSEDYEQLEAKRREMAERANNMGNIIQNNPLAEFVDESDQPTQINVNRNLEGVVDETTKKTVQNNSSTKVNDSRRTMQSDPVFEMFKNVKRKSPFSMSLKISEKIPTKDFIKMWEDNYEMSIIDFLADEFLDKLLRDREAVKQQIREALEKKVYTTTKRKSTK